MADITNTLLKPLTDFAAQADADLATARANTAAALAAAATAAKAEADAKLQSLAAHATLDAMRGAADVATVVEKVEASPNTKWWLIGAGLVLLGILAGCGYYVVKHGL